MTCQNVPCNLRSGVEIRPVKGQGMLPLMWCRSTPNFSLRTSVRDRADNTYSCITERRQRHACDKLAGHTTSIRQQRPPIPIMEHEVAISLKQSHWVCAIDTTPSDSVAHSLTPCDMQHPLGLNQHIHSHALMKSQLLAHDSCICVRCDGQCTHITHGLFPRLLSRMSRQRNAVQLNHIDEPARHMRPRERNGVSRPP
jgi:hypothetical protein